MAWWTSLLSGLLGTADSGDQQSQTGGIISSNPYGDNVFSNKSEPSQKSSAPTSASSRNYDVSSGVGGGGASAGTNVQPLSSSSSGSESYANASNAMDYVGGAISQVGDLTSLITPWTSYSSAKAQAEAEKEKFDKVFEENKRQFGLQFALKEWATRKNIEMQEAIDRWNRKMQKRSFDEGVKKSAMDDYYKAMEFSWMKEDREKSQKMAEAYSKGLLKGLGGKV